MHMKHIIIGGVVLLVVGVGAWWFFGQSKVAEAPEATPDVVNDANEVVEVEVSGGRGKGSLASLFALGKSQSCTFVVRTEGVLQEGSAFYAGDKARIDTLISTGASEPMASYVIMDKEADTMYLWNNSKDIKVGMKMSISAQEKLAATQGAAATTVTPTTSTVDTNLDVDYDCTPWQVDGSVFVPPADIEFTDMSAMMDMMQSMEGVKLPQS